MLTEPPTHSSAAWVMGWEREASGEVSQRRRGLPVDREHHVDDDACLAGLDAAAFERQRVGDVGVLLAHSHGEIAPVSGCCLPGIEGCGSAVQAWGRRSRVLGAIAVAGSSTAAGLAVVSPAVADQTGVLACSSPRRRRLRSKRARSARSIQRTGAVVPAPGGGLVGEGEDPVGVGGAHDGVDADLVGEADLGTDTNEHLRLSEMACTSGNHVLRQMRTAPAVQRALISRSDAT
ncbi:hypothetical protein [Streptomyces sp. 2R]|uniref:hypothetical protein n=1 Tax=Streptomyces sp. 2R TaxID=1883452 RepID=UPI0015C628B2|nr:hypothetical protein [Streptomyces sp. 2R]